MDREWTEVSLDGRAINVRVVLGCGGVEFHNLCPSFILSVDENSVIAMKGETAMQFSKDAAAGAASRIAGLQVAAIPQTGETVEAPQGPKLGSQKHSQPDDTQAIKEALIKADKALISVREEGGAERLKSGFYWSYEAYTAYQDALVREAERKESHA